VWPTATASPQPLTYNIQQGWNLSAYTGSASGIDTAAQLLGALLQQSGGSLAAYYALNNNQWTPSLIDSGGSFSPPNGDFPLQPDAGYLHGANHRPVPHRQHKAPHARAHHPWRLILGSPILQSRHPGPRPNLPGTGCHVDG
jgi:hypothetical protein